jgi:hypothetical protein
MQADESRDSVLQIHICESEYLMRTFSALFVIPLATSGLAQTIDCGRAPENITDITYAKSLWEKYMHEGHRSSRCDDSDCGYSKK